jgi:AraC family transcriptional regulator
MPIKFTLEGGITMEYKIIDKESFVVVGTTREFNMETSYAEIPKFWSEHFESGNGKYVCGVYGICFNDTGDNKSFSYMIADNYNQEKVIPGGFITKEIPASTWAIFPCKGAMPKALQDVNTRIWNEWLPNCREYEIAGDFNVEMYSDGDTNSEDYYSEIWIPVKKS